MKVIIKETGNVETLSIVVDQTAKEKVNYALDLIGNYGGLTDGSFELDQDSGVYYCSQDTFDWWSRVLRDQQALQDRIEELKEIHGADAVDEAISRADDCDLEDQAAAVNKALDEAFPGN